MRADLLAAFLLLTRLPVACFCRPDEVSDPARAVWAYPVVGIVVGGIGGAAFWVGASLGLPPVLAAIWTLAAMLWTTGALHEDGAADTADGFGGGATRERKLEIMRDSRIGAFGALALLLALSTRVAALTLLGRPAAVAGALIVAGALARSTMAGLLAALPPARADGLAAGLHPAGATAAAACGIAALAGLLLLPGRLAVTAIMATALSAVAMRRLANRQVGGHTGDILGATEILTECVVLTIIASARHQ
jgi:adenosylcobinamide-GDP ribazoletransferase